ncbi:TPR repeat protein oca3 [Erysiphe neolycopersici]|uniref:ER membrane protein complex subunit 2 n=1 Tax=Erysiphe neolycopersici TaxID=212602 RepID=A0A420HYQ3_9PEZI|nr:TPR repeat protein oca3 [Erysiphe neolycopersici]
MIFSPLVLLSNPITLKISAQAPKILQNILPAKYLNIFSTTETPELWLTYESLVYSCLRTGDEKSANNCLKRLTERFGEDNERVMGIAGLYKEAIAKDEAELEKILDEYENILRKDPTNMPISKRRIALLKSLERPDKAILALNRLLDTSPNDAENWAELSDLYIAQGMYKQAIFALEELLLIHARLGEVLYMSSSTAQTGREKLLIEAIQCFCRSIELCDDYFRGYYGLKFVINELEDFQNSGSQVRSPLSYQELDRLNKLATLKLSEISQRSVNSDFSQQGYSTAELILMREIISHGLPSRSKDR